MQTFGAAYLEDVQKKAGPTYDKFATVIALLTFLFITSQIVILAAEVNVVNARKLWPRTLLPLAGGLTEADRRAYAHYADSQRRVPTQRILVDYEATPNPEQP